MSLRTKVLRLVEIVLRVPPLFIIDEILKVGIVLSDFTEHDLSGFEHSFEDNATNISSAIQYDPTFYRLVLATFIRFTLCLFGKNSNQKSFFFNCQHTVISFNFRLHCITVLVCIEYTTPYDSLHVLNVHWGSTSVVLVKRWNDEASTYYANWR